MRLQLQVRCFSRISKPFVLYAVPKPTKKGYRTKSNNKEACPARSIITIPPRTCSLGFHLLLQAGAFLTKCKHLTPTLGKCGSFSGTGIPKHSPLLGSFVHLSFCVGQSIFWGAARVRSWSMNCPQIIVMCVKRPEGLSISWKILISVGIWEEEHYIQRT